MPRPRPRAVLPVVAALALACAGDRPEDLAPPESRGGTTLTVEDQIGRAVTLSGPATRIVSLVPSATLTLAALGAQDALVGRTDYDTASWAAPLPSVGGGLQPSMEALVALDPDLVVLFGGDQDPVTPARLDQLDIPWVGIRPDRIADVLDIVDLLGRVTGRAARATALQDSLRAELDAVRAEALAPPGPKVAYVMGGSPPWVAGPGTYIDELIALAGGRNAFEDLNALYSAVSPEELVSRGIDVVLVSDAARFDRRLTPGARVVEVDAAVELPGPGVAESARAVLRALRGGGG